MQAGITLIALVITIIVLIILAMVTIAMLIGPNGLLNKSVDAKIENAHGEVRERLQLEAQAYYSERLEKTYIGGLLTYLQEKKHYIDDNGKVIIGNLAKGEELPVGNGSGDEDIYKVEEITSTEEATSNGKKYEVNYYGKNGENKVTIGTLSEGKEISGSTSSSKPGSVGYTGTYVNVNNYGKQVSGFKAGEIDKWRLFAQTDEYTYIISDTLPETYQFSQGERSTLSEWGKKLTPAWTNKNMTYENSRAVAYLLDTSVWEKYKGDGLYAIGTPTLELFIDSWNATHKDSDLKVSMGSVGNGLLINNNVIQDINSGAAELEGNSPEHYNGIYYGGTSDFTEGGITENKWYLAAGTDIADDNYTMWAAKGGKINFVDVRSSKPIRPVVCFETSNFKYNLID